MKIAIVHEMLVKLWWAEKVLESMIWAFPDADVFTLLYDEKKVWTVFPRKKIHPNCFSLASQRLYSLTKKQRFSLPFMRRSVESLTFDTYDVVIISSSWFAHGIRTQTKTIVYYHAPARYMWDWAHEYRKEIWCNTWLKSYFYGRLLLSLRKWDYSVAQTRDIILANSFTTQKRIEKYYRRNSEVVYPPIETKRFSKQVTHHSIKKTYGFSSYYIIISAITEFKRIDVAIQAFKEMWDINLLIVWDGDQRDKLKTISKNHKNIQFAGTQFWDDLVSIVQQSSGLIFPWEEDFWIVPIEVMAAGKPVFALKKWWLTETVTPKITWDFFLRPDGSDFIESFKNFHAQNQHWQYAETACKKQASKFDISLFQQKLRSLVHEISETN